MSELNSKRVASVQQMISSSELVVVILAVGDGEAMCRARIIVSIGHDHGRKLSSVEDIGTKRDLERSLVEAFT